MTKGDMAQACAIRNKEIKIKELLTFSQNRRTKGQQMGCWGYRFQTITRSFSKTQLNDQFS